MRVKDEIRMDCPYCRAADHLYLNLRKRAWICFRCGKKGRGFPEGASSAVVSAHKRRMRHGNYYLSNWSAAQNQARFDRRQIPPSKMERRLPQDFHPFTILGPQAEEHVSPPELVTVLGLNGAAVLRYLTQVRGLFVSELVGYHVGYGVGTAIFPIFGLQHDLQYYVARRLRGTPPYTNAPWPRKGVILDSSLSLLQKSGGPLTQEDFKFSKLGLSSVRVLVEGVFDAILLGRIVPTVCALGKQLSPMDYRLLQTWGVQRLIVAFDADATGEAVEIADAAISWIPEVQVHRLAEGDPADHWRELGHELTRYWR